MFCILMCMQLFVPLMRRVVCHTSLLVPFDDTYVLELDNIAWNVVHPHFHTEQVGSEGNDGLSMGEANGNESAEGGSEDETFVDDDCSKDNSDDDESSVGDSGNGSGDHTGGGHIDAFSASHTAKDLFHVQGPSSS